MGDTAYITSLYNVQELPERVIDAWHKLRTSNPLLYSPYFHPDYTMEVAKQVADVRVAVLKKNNEIVAILPYQGQSFARPVGAPFTDYHGIICGPNSSVSLQDMLAHTPVGAFHYSALVKPLDETVSNAHHGAVIAFPHGSQVWRNQRDSSFKKHQKSIKRRIRKVTEEIGAPLYVSQDQDEAVFNQLIKWKIAQYKESGYYNVLGADWTLDLLKSLWSKESNAALRVDMHTLYFGDKLAAVDTGLTDGQTYHSWIVAYDPQFHIYSPGTQLLNQVIDSSDTLGYHRIDLGVGIDNFKKYYATENVQTTSGFAAISGPAAKLSQLYDAAERFGQKSLSDTPGKLRRRYLQISACENTITGRAKAILSAVKSSRS